MFTADHGDFLGDQGTWLDLAMAKGLARGRFTQMGPTDLAHAWAWLPDLAQDVVRVADLARRDRLDSSRQASPLTTAADAVIVDTTDMGPAIRRIQFPERSRYWQDVARSEMI